MTQAQTTIQNGTSLSVIRGRGELACEHCSCITKYEHLLISINCPPPQCLNSKMVCSQTIRCFSPCGSAWPEAVHSQSRESWIRCNTLDHTTWDVCSRDLERVLGGWSRGTVVRWGLQITLDVKLSLGLGKTLFREISFVYISAPAS